jgi:predicted nucleic acid-binding protein
MTAILDAGPLISLWNDDENSSWARQIFKKYHGPFYVTELILAEVAHLTDRDEELAVMIRAGKLMPGAGIWEDAGAIERCVKAYPHCGLADASIIVASERRPRLNVLTTDRRHFVTYRRGDGSPLPLVLPD